MTGLGSSIAESSRPLASPAVAGITTLRPGTWANHASRLCECWAAAPVPEPSGARSTIGTVAAPPSMKWILAAWLTIWSIAWLVKSENWISTIGRMPASAGADGGADDAELGDRGVPDPLAARSGGRGRR